MHDAGQEVLTAVAAVKKGPWYNTGRRRLITVATFWLKVETGLHDSLPFRPMWSRPLTIFTGLPVDDQVGDFVRNGIAQEIIEVFRK